MIYTYTGHDFIYDTSWEVTRQSPFDELLQSKWNTAVDNGYFRYQLNIRETKRLPGKHCFLAQLNTDRATNRRPPQDISSLTQPFDHQKFNFTKISDNEILFEVERGDESTREPRRKDLLVINVSPHEFGHSMFLPEITACLPQILTLYCLQRTLELLLLSDTPSLRAGYNSLCAFATVNHLHFHLYYLKYTLLLETVKVVKFSGECYILTEYPAVGFAFQLNKHHNIHDLASSVYKLTYFLQENNIAHNVFITRGCCFEGDSDNNTTLSTLRVYVWARKHSTGPKNVKGFDPAVCELSGHLIVKIPEPFASLTEADVAKELNGVCQEPFDRILDDVQMLFEGKHI